MLNPWIQAARLRTLPLAMSGILLGSAVSYLQGFNTNYPYPVIGLALLTALFLQVLSNYANDYGDFDKGVDIQAKRTDRALSGGKILPYSMRIALWILGLLVLVLGLCMIYISGLLYDHKGFFLLGLGLFSIVAALAYTLGENAYGYYGFGDLFVLLFFGLVPVLGMGLLLGCDIDMVFLLAGLGMGLLATGVLNVNNYRDLETDKAMLKKTLAVRLGAKKTLVYHRIVLVLGSLLLPSSFLVFERTHFGYSGLPPVASIFLLGVFSPVFALLSQHYRVLSETLPGNRITLNKELKKLSLVVLLAIIIYCTMAWFVIDFMGINKNWEN
ncbi:MAG: 1,4-dihydroxy-2-naphthoate octaprenyltransferase [Flavobacteriales bacterium]|nr:MAG: 1,4-dihydroxy-2-naphthoate octaprenyltransferase [Flavobacteriales bacterium]